MSAVGEHQSHHMQHFDRVLSAVRPLDLCAIERVMNLDIGRCDQRLNGLIA